MASTNVEVSVRTDEIAKRLRDASKKDTTVFFSALSEDLVNDVNEAFETSGESTGEAWAPNAESTLKKKAAAGKGSKPLIYDGIWQGTPTKESGSDFARVGTAVKYSIYNVEKRTPYKLTPERLATYAEWLADWLASQIMGRAWRKHLKKSR